MRLAAEGPTRATITGLILAGGQGRRMGGCDKGLVDLDGRPLIAHVISRLAPQVASILISANRNPERYAALGAAVLPDGTADFPGPLAGILTGLRAASTPWLAVVPCDSPFLPDDLVPRLADRVPSSQGIAVAYAAGELQPVFALIPTVLRESLAEFLHQGHRKILRWFEQHPLVAVEFGDDTPAFLNINTEYEHELALARLRHGSAHD